jgi:hypothetical protein
MNPATTNSSPYQPVFSTRAVPSVANQVTATPATSSPVTTNQFTKQVIRQLLDGAAADTFAAIPLSTYGPWAEVVRLLFEAYAEGEAHTEGGAHTEGRDRGVGGTRTVATVYRSLVRVDDQLTLLMAGDEEAPRRSFKMRELLTADFPPQRFIIPGLIPEGLTILAARPCLSGG